MDPRLRGLRLGMILLSALVWAVYGASDETDGNTTGSSQIGSAEMVQREIDRRRESTFRLNEILDLAERMYRSGEWEHAEAKYNLVLLETDPEAETKGFYRRAQIGKAKCLAAQGLAKEEQGKLSEAAGFFQQAADLDLANKGLAKKAKDVQEAGVRQADPYPGNSAVSEDFIKKTEDIKRLLSLADQLTETGQYLAARKKLDDVLRLDPYHRQARKKIEVLEEKRMQAADERYLASREKALAKVSEAWLPPPPAKIDQKKGRQTSTARGSNAAALIKKTGGNQDTGNNLQ